MADRWTMTAGMSRRFTMRDPYSIPANGPKRFTSFLEFRKEPKILLQTAATAIQKMRSNDSPGAIWTLDMDWGASSDALWVKAQAPVKHGFPSTALSDAGPSDTTLEITCAVRSVGGYCLYELTFVEHIFGFSGGADEILVLSTCWRIVTYLVEVKLLQPDWIAGFWQMREGSWNHPWIVEAFTDRSALVPLMMALNSDGALTIQHGADGVAARIRSSVLP